MKKAIVLTLTLEVIMNTEKMGEDERVKEQVAAVVDKVQHHFNKDLSNTDVTEATHIKTAFVKLEQVVDRTAGEVEQLV